MGCCVCEPGYEYTFNQCVNCGPITLPTCYALIEHSGARPDAVLAPQHAVPIVVDGVTELLCYTSPSNICGQYTGPKTGTAGCGLSYVFTWQIDEDCETIYISLSVGSYGLLDPYYEVYNTTTTDRDWYLTPLVMGPYTITMGGWSTAVQPTITICCVTMTVVGNQSWADLIPYWSDGMERLFVIERNNSYCAGIEPETCSSTGWCGRLIMCGTDGKWTSTTYMFRWTINKDFDEILFEFYIPASLTVFGDQIIASTTISASEWDGTAVTLDGHTGGLGTWPDFTFERLCDTPPPDPPADPPPPPCDPSSGDCFPDCISSMGDPDCTTPQHALLFIDIVGPPGRGCCIDSTHTLTYGAGFGAGYSLHRSLTACNTSGGDPVWFEMELFCSGTDIVLNTKRLDVRGIQTDTSDVISMTCVGDNVSYSFTFGARYMCDSATIGEIYTVTIYSNL